MFIFQNTLFTFEKEGAWEQAELLKNWSDSGCFKEWANTFLTLKRSNLSPSVR